MSFAKRKAIGGSLMISEESLVGADSLDPAGRRYGRNDKQHDNKQRAPAERVVVLAN